MECVKALKKSYPTKTTSLGVFLEEKYRGLHEANDFQHVRDIIEALLITNTITRDEADYRRAISFEEEADFEESKKGENTFMMRTHMNYQDAYRMIYRVKNIYPEDEKRIKRKVQEANRTFAYMMHHGAGIQTYYVVPEEIQQAIKKECEQMEVTKTY